MKRHDIISRVFQQIAKFYNGPKVDLYQISCVLNTILCICHYVLRLTVRVTAAVYWGFYSKLLRLLLFTFQHRAGVRPYTSCYHLAESCVFNKQSPPSSMCHFAHHRWIEQSTPSPEVTGSICRVPSTWLSQAP